MSKLILCSLVVVLTGLLSACSPLTVVNAVSPAGSIQATRALHYGSDPRNALDVYRPAGNAASAPVIVFFYGGNWVSGKREDYAFVGRALAARGFVVVVPDYRLYPHVRYPDFLVDSAGALAWTAREITAYGGDPKQIFVMGHSAGAYNASMVALDPSYLARYNMRASALRGWIGLAGPYNFLPIYNPTTKPVFNFPDTPASSQPINHVSKSSPPALLIAANKDDLVNPARNTGALASKLRANGVTVQEVYFDGVNHVTLVASIAAPLRSLAPTLDAIDTFIGSDAGRSTTITAR